MALLKKIHHNSSGLKITVSLIPIECFLHGAAEGQDWKAQLTGSLVGVEIVS